MKTIKIFLILAVCCFNAQADDIQTGWCSDDITFWFNRTTGELRIDGTGSPKKYHHNDYAATSFQPRNAVKHLVVG